VSSNIVVVFVFVLFFCGIVVIHAVLVAIEFP